MKDRTIIDELLGAVAPGLVVMGGDSCSEGRRVESKHCILDGMDIFSHYLL